jgi:hypothetical protein
MAEVAGFFHGLFSPSPVFLLSCSSYFFLISFLPDFAPHPFFSSFLFSFFPVRFFFFCFFFISLSRLARSLSYPFSVSSLFFFFLVSFSTEGTGERD